MIIVLPFDTLSTENTEYTGKSEKLTSKSIFSGTKTDPSSIISLLRYHLTFH